MVETVQDIMTKEVVTIDMDQSALQAAKLMTEKRISSLIVLDKKQPVGIVTERDFVKKICTKQLEVSKIQITEIMSMIRTYAEPQTPIHVAIQRMLNHNIRRLPIISEGNVIGIITVTDLAKHLRTELLIQGALGSSKKKIKNSKQES
jgi:CBS domain-containing protein